MKIYIENLHDTIDNAKLSEVFSYYGGVQSVQVVKDIFTGASRGFGYVEMDDEFGQSAISALDQTTLNDLTITVKEAPVVTKREESSTAANGPVKVYRFKEN